MVFSVNAVESSANNFAAFKAKAIQLNGTASSSGTSSSTSTGAQPTQTQSGGSMKMSDRGAGVAVGLVGVVVGALLA
jgi:hypothetical protein